MGSTEELEPTEADLWYALPSEIPDELLLRYEPLLSSEERARHKRLVFAEDRRAYLVTRALVRTCLSRYCDLAPADWQFTTNRYGRPEISSPAAALLRFNVTHTKGLVACLVALDREVGVDTENTERQLRMLELARDVFSSEEQAVLRSLSGDEQRRRFFEYWTLKEAYVKARGLGLSLPLQGFSFALGLDGSIAISFEPTLRDDPLSWQFALLRPSEPHQLAVALRRGHGPDVRIRVRPIVPLAD